MCAVTPAAIRAVYVTNVLNDFPAAEVDDAAVSAEGRRGAGGARVSEVAAGQVYAGVHHSDDLASSAEVEVREWRACVVP